jgi:hypothetical protein
VTDFGRPDPSEHAEYYARYVALVPDGDIATTLRDQLGETVEMLRAIPTERETFRYAEEKWTLREVIGHLIDTERMFAFRALAMAREDGVDLPGMDQDAWSTGSNAADRSLDDLIEEWISVRRSNVHLFGTMPAGAGDRKGRASGFEFTVRSFPWIIAGHELWHRHLIRRDYVGDA